MANHDGIDEQDSRSDECPSFCAVSNRERLAFFHRSPERSNGVALFIGLGRRQLTLMMALCWEPRDPLLPWNSIEASRKRKKKRKKKETIYKQEEWLCFKVLTIEAYVLVRETMDALQFSRPSKEDILCRYWRSPGKTETCDSCVMLWG